MLEYAEHKGVLLDRYEWAGGLGMGHKSVAKAQVARRREVKRGGAIIVDFDKKYNI